MVIKCYNKPNRTKERKFTVCDAARVADRARVSEGVSGGVVVSTVGLRMGYGSLIDGSKLTDSQVLVEIQELLTIGEIISDVALLLPGNVIWKVVFYVVRNFSDKFATLIAPICVALINRHKLPPANRCN